MIKNIIVCASIFLVLSCSSKKHAVKNYTEGDDLEYYNTFTEATKLALLSNFKSALGLYQLCIANYPERAAPYYQVSNIYLSVNEFGLAKRYAIEAVKYNDKNKWYLMHLANLYQYESKMDSVIYIYEKVVELEPNPEYRYNLAAMYSSKGEVVKSMKLIKELEKENSGMRELILMKHHNYNVLDDKDSAVYQLEKLVKLFPDDFENYGMLAEYLSEINRFDYAKKIYQDLLIIEPNNGLANISYGDFFLKQGDKDSALVYYKRGFVSEEIKIEDKIGIIYNYIYDPVAVKSDSAFIEELLRSLIQIHSTDSRSYTLSAEYYIKKQNYPSALIELSKAIENEPNSYVVWEQYIMISNFLGEFERVAECYEEGITLFPKEVKFFIYSSYSLYAIEMYQESIDLTEKAMLIENLSLEDKVQVMNQAADSYRGLEEYDVSDSIYEEILILDSENLLIRNNYSYYLSVRDKDLERAKELSALTVRKEPSNATYLDTYGWILYKMGNYKDAVKYIEAAIKNGAYTNGEVLEHYGEAVFKLGRCTEAIEAWNEAIKNDSSYKEKLEIRIKDAKENCEED